MAKGSGTSKRSAGGGKTAGGASLQEIINNSGGVYASDYLRNGMRPASLEYARQAYASGGNPTLIATTQVKPIVMFVQREGRHGFTVMLNDGRHRMTAAREAGATHIRAKVTEYGPRGGRLRTWEGVVRL